MTYLERFGSISGDATHEVDVQRDMNDFMECCTMGESPQPGKAVSLRAGRYSGWAPLQSSQRWACPLAPPISYRLHLRVTYRIGHFGGLNVTPPRAQSGVVAEATRDQKP